MPDTETIEKKSNKERIKEIVAGIEDGIQKLFQSEQYFDYLRTMSRFHSYSVNNTILIHLQKPDASVVAGYSQWKNRFGRHVKKGEKGITVIAPTPFKKKVEEMKLDPDTHEPVYSDDGQLIMEEKVVEIPMFKPVKVFDVSQTDGKPLPQLSTDLAGDVQQYEAFMEALRRSSPVPIEFQSIDESMDGYFSRDEQKIVVRTGMSQVQTVCAAVHEIGHAKIQLFEDKRIRTAWDEEKEEWYFSIVDVVAVLTDQPSCNSLSNRNQESNRLAHQNRQNIWSNSQTHLLRKRTHWMLYCQVLQKNLFVRTYP